MKRIVLLAIVAIVLSACGISAVAPVAKSTVALGDAPRSLVAPSDTPVVSSPTWTFAPVRIAVLATAALARTPTVASDRVVTKVLRVADGDTIEVSIGGRSYTVRYIGMDTPETVAPNTPVQWMGPEATVANKALVENKTVSLEKDVSETDRYGHLLRYVYVGDVFVNAELVRQGLCPGCNLPA